MYVHPEMSEALGGPSVDCPSAETDLKDFEGVSGPEKLVLCLTSRCNLRCTHCLRKTHPNLPECTTAHDLPRELLEMLISHFFPKVRAVRLGGFSIGETMLSKDFPFVLERALEHPSLCLEVMTNGTLLTRVPGTLLASAISRIHISIEGFGSSYSAVRGVSWDSFQRNLDHLLEARARSSQPRRPVVCLDLIPMSPHLEDCLSLVDFAKEKGIDLIDVNDFFPATYSDCRKSLLYQESLRTRFLREFASHAESLGVRYVLPMPIPPDSASRRKSPRVPCAMPFELIGFQSDGSVIPCCYLSSGYGKLSSMEGAIDALWRSEAYTALRRRVNSDDPPPACRTCSVVNLNPLVYRQPSWMVAVKDAYLRSPLSRLHSGRKAAHNLARRFLTSHVEP